MTGSAAADSRRLELTVGEKDCLWAHVHHLCSGQAAHGPIYCERAGQDGRLLLMLAELFGVQIEVREMPAGNAPGRHMGGMLGSYSSADEVVAAALNNVTLTAPLTADEEAVLRGFVEALALVDAGQVVFFFSDSPAVETVAAKAAELMGRHLEMLRGRQ